jgi:hypothetical protein
MTAIVTPDQLPFNSTVTFDVYPAQMLGDDFNNCKVLAIVDADTAKYWIDPVAMHRNVYATLPAGTAADKYDSYMYVKIKRPSGMVTAVGLPWIRPESLRIISTRKILVTVDNVTAEDEPKILEALSANGYKNVGIQHID